MTFHSREVVPLSHFRFREYFFFAILILSRRLCRNLVLSKEISLLRTGKNCKSKIDGVAWLGYHSCLWFAQKYDLREHYDLRVVVMKI